MKENDEVIGNLLSGTRPESADTMDSKRVATTIQDFLLKLDQAREWVCDITGESCDISKFKEELPKAEMLAKIVQVLDKTFTKKIHISAVKEYKHIDNIMFFLSWLKRIKLRKHFFFETVDLYDSKNIPKVIFCLHGLACFLNKRGYSRGIVVRNDVVFTNQETSLFEDDVKNIAMQKFEDISNKLDSEDEGIIEYDSEVMNGSDSENMASEETIKLFSRSLLWKSAFTGIVYKGQVPIQSIRKFVDFTNDRTAQIINEQEGEIIKKFKNNHEKDKEKDEILRTIRLLLENQASLREVFVEIYPLANDFKNFKRALYLLIHDYDLFRAILNAGFELPLRVIFPDNLLGDFHFSHLIFDDLESSYNECVLDEDAENSFTEGSALKIARAHFITSKCFKNLVEAFTTNETFDLNPITISESLQKKAAGSLDKRKMLDEAIGDEAVRTEILRRAQMIVDFVVSKYQFLLGVDFPYYVRKFVDHPLFFENFIEPAIIHANNFIISELFSYIFHSSESECRFSDLFGQERMLLRQEKFEKTCDFDFTDYSPLKDFLDQCRDDFRHKFVNKHRVNVGINDFFMSHFSNNKISSKTPLQVEINIQEINNIIIVLKKCMECSFALGQDMANAINDLSLLRCGRSEDFKIEVFSSVKEMPVEFKNGTFEGDAEKSREEEVVVSETFKELLLKSSKTVNDPMLFKERFTLQLDNQSQEQREGDDLAMNALVRDLKHRILLLISISNKNDLPSILNSTDSFEIEMISQNGLDLEEIEEFKRSVIEDLNFLSNSSFIGKRHFKGQSSDKFSACCRKILNLIANDILMNKYRVYNREISMNQETSDALFKKGLWLDKYLKYLYSYLNDLVAGMFINKSGTIFNRQVEPKSLYGTYKFPLSSAKVQIYEDIDDSQFSFVISCNEPMVFEITVLCGDKMLSDKKLARFDDLLRLKEDGVICFDFNELCCFSVAPLVELINCKYINY